MQAKGFPREAFCFFLHQTILRIGFFFQTSR